MSKRADRLIVFYVALGLMLVPVFYVASAVPVIWLGQRGYLPQTLVGAPLYTPIVAICQKWPPLAAAMTWHLGLWGINVVY